ncbi:ferric reductase like transmembrane component-domain-containing protein [Aspergillus falconensis]
MQFPTFDTVCGLLVVLARPVASMATGRAGHGFIGYGISMYKPPCAYACRATITNPLNCTTSSDSHLNMGMDMDMHVDGMQMGDGWMIEDSPSAECYVTNDAFLQTLALCMHSHCKAESNAMLERYWEMNVAGSNADQPLPKESYQETLRAINGTPPVIWNASSLLQSAGHIPNTSYAVEYRTLTVFEDVEASHVTYGLVLLLTGAVIPTGLSIVRFVPLPAAWTTHFKATLIDPPLFGSRHNAPYLWNTFIMPTRGQALFIAYQIAINVILSAVSIKSADPSTWYISQRREIVTYVSNRVGALSFANIPLLILYSSRNNVLLWLTNWSQGTFLLLHRWIALIAVIEACLHSAIYLHICDIDGTHATESRSPFWYWGIIAILAMVAILPASLLPVRQKAYELFLAWHIFFFLLAMIGCLLHIYYRYAWQWGYENWIYIGFAVWGFDRLLRILRLARNGICMAHITVIDEDYVKLQIPGIMADGHVYLYFPTLTWKVWENHPFSIIADTYQSNNAAIIPPNTRISSPSSSIGPKDPESNVLAVTTQETTEKGAQDPHPHQPGLTIYVRTHTGITAHLRGQRSTLPVLVEGAYLPAPILGSPPSQAPNIIAFAGGVGVTALTSTLLSHRGWHKLFWGVRSKALVDSVRQSLSASGFDRLRATIFLEQRMDIPRILAAEIARFSESGSGSGMPVTVLVSGPPAMADEVRVEVTRLGRDNPAVVLTLVQESFSW